MSVGIGLQSAMNCTSPATLGRATTPWAESEKNCMQLVSEPAEKVVAALEVANCMQFVVQCNPKLKEKGEL